MVREFDVVRKRGHSRMLPSLVLSLSLARALSVSLFPFLYKHSASQKPRQLTARPAGSRRPRPSQSPKSTRQAGFPGWPARAPTGGVPSLARAGAAAAAAARFRGCSRTPTTREVLLPPPRRRRRRQRRRRRLLLLLRSTTEAPAPAEATMSKNPFRP